MLFWFAEITFDEFKEIAKCSLVRATKPETANDDAFPVFAFI